MITRLLPSQVSSRWQGLRKCIEVSLPPHLRDSEEAMSRILESCMVGALDVWLIHSPINNGSDVELYAVGTTAISVDPIALTKNLLIYSLYARDGMPPEMWADALKEIKKFARSRGCSGIVAYSNVSAAVSLASRLGADTSYTFISMEV